MYAFRLVNGEKLMMLVKIEVDDDDADDED